MRRSIVGLAAFLILATARALNGAILVQSDFIGGGLLYDTISEVDMDFTHEKGFPATIHARLFDDLILSPADIGKTFIAASTTDPEFPAFAAYLTDGQNDRVMFRHASGGVGKSEALFCYGDPNATKDLKGYYITGIDLLVNDFALTPVSLGTFVSFDFTVTVEGYIPEASSLIIWSLR